MPPVEVIRGAATYAPDFENVRYRWQLRDPNGPFGGLLVGPQTRSTTQAALGALLPSELRTVLDNAGFTDVYWGDDELSADLVAFLAAQGIEATVVPATADDGGGEEEAPPPP